MGGWFGCLFVKALCKRCLMGSATPCIALIYIDLGAERALRRVLRSPRTMSCHGCACELEPRGVCQRALPSLAASQSGVSSTRHSCRPTARVTGGPGRLACSPYHATRTLRRGKHATALTPVTLHTGRLRGVGRWHLPRCLLAIPNTMGRLHSPLALAARAAAAATAACRHARVARALCCCRCPPLRGRVRMARGLRHGGPSDPKNPSLV